MSRRAALPLLVLLALLMSGCGPTVPLKVLMRQLVENVRFGSANPPGPTPSPVPAYIPPPPPTDTFNYTPPSPSAEVLPLASPTPFVCASLNPQTVIKNPATPALNTPPPQGVYPLRSTGSQSLGSSPKTALPAVLYVIQPAQPKPGKDQVNGSFYDYSLFTGYSKTSYTAFNLRLANANPATPGVLVTSISIRDSLRGPFDFVATQPFQLLPTPASVGSSWTVAATDPLNQTSVEFQANIPKRDTVNACGRPLDSFQVHIDGRLVSPSMQLTWTGDYDIGTQYGGLILAEHVIFSGSDSSGGSSQPYAYDETSIINAEPPLTP